LGLLLQILVFLIIAAALGFAVGWLVRGARLQTEAASLEADGRSRLVQLEHERDRLRAELEAAGGGSPGAGQRASADAAQAAARVTGLEKELAQAQKVNARHQAEVGRLEARIAELEAATAATPARTASTAALEHPPAEGTGAPPPALAGPEGSPDDLQQISGIGPGIERTLHELGIFHFRQIAAFTPDNVAWVNRRLRFKGRIEREDWIGQAKRLTAGGAPLQ
jgi:NADH-quinone oxidoreductase subunit E